MLLSLIKCIIHIFYCLVIFINLYYLLLHLIISCYYPGILVHLKEIIKGENIWKKIKHFMFILKKKF